MYKFRYSLSNLYALSIDFSDKVSNTMSGFLMAPHAPFLASIVETTVPLRTMANMRTLLPYQIFRGSTSWPVGVLD